MYAYNWNINQVQNIAKAFSGKVSHVVYKEFNEQTINANPNILKDNNNEIFKYFFLFNT